MSEPYITLRQAMESGRLAAFSAQEEKRGIGSIPPQDLDQAIKKIVTEPQRLDQTSGSRAPGGSTEKKTPSRT